MAFFLTLIIGALTMYLPILMKKDYGKRSIFPKSWCILAALAQDLSIQMVFIQKFNLLFASPILSVALVLGATFFFGGIGTYVGSLFEKSGRFIYSVIHYWIAAALYSCFRLDFRSHLQYETDLSIRFRFLRSTIFHFFYGNALALRLEWIKYFEPKVILHGAGALILLFLL